MDSRAVLIVSLGFVVIMGMIFCGIMSVQQQCRCDCCPCDACPDECPAGQVDANAVAEWLRENQGKVILVYRNQALELDAKRSWVATENHFLVHLTDAMERERGEAPPATEATP